MSTPLAREPSLRDLDDCGCCAGIEALTPEAISNRPGLPTLSTRVGTHSSLLANMLAALTAAERPALRRLATREGDDLTIAFLDAVATAADVLTFYSERIANEAYLRTASERRSVLELARAIGYELAPGVAAETMLAFSLEVAVGAPEVVELATGTKVQSVPGPGERPQTFETVEEIEARPQWNELVPRRSRPLAPHFGQTAAHLAGVETNLHPGDAILIVGDERAENPRAERWDFRFLDTVEPDHERGVTRIGWKPFLGTDDPHVEPAQRGARIYALRTKASLFGASAPDWRTLPDVVRTRYDESGAAAAKSEWPDFAISAIDRADDAIHLDGLHREILAQPERESRPESWLVLRRRGYEELYRVVAVDESARKGFGLAAKTTRLELEGERLHFFDENIRDLVAYAQSEELEWAEAPITEAVWGEEIELERVVPGLAPGRSVIVSGRLANAPADAATVSEVAVVESSAVVGGVTTLVLARKLANSYRRETVRIAANVARATHGESTSQPVGSGDASKALQRFELRLAPLTHVYAEMAPGRRSTLEVRVDGLRWEQVPSLYGRRRSERVYAVRIDDEQRATVQFGDGDAGARPPSGQENVTAAYRTGLGREGNLDPGKLTLLPARPLGVRAVTNPLPASGGADPETLSDARANAPLTVLTLGRTVSLADYADFARSFAGIAKAHATWVWGPGGRGVLLTVAGSAGDEVPDDGPVHRSLLAAIANAGDPHVAVILSSYERVEFRVAARIRCGPEHDPERVRADAEAALAASFSFLARDFGEPVPLSAVYSALHGVTGVVAVDIDGLYTGAAAELRQSLEAAVPSAGSDAASARPAQLLTIDLRAGDLEVSG